MKKPNESKKNLTLDDLIKMGAKEGLFNDKK